MQLEFNSSRRILCNTWLWNHWCKYETIPNIYHFKIFSFLQQLFVSIDGDYISIQEIDSSGNQKLIAYLTGPDRGPKSELAPSNWNKKIISSSTNKMNIEFKSDGVEEYKGFSANIYFAPIPNKECESWLDMNKKTLKSPKYPLTHDYSIKCSWLINVDHDYHLTLDVSQFHVRYQIIFILIHLLDKYFFEI